MEKFVTEQIQKLLRALDCKYNVTNMPVVLEVISVFEKIVISPELLETTRLAKYLNDLRKSLTDEGLSKRIKELLKKWKNIVHQVQINMLNQQKRPLEDAIDNNLVKRPKLEIPEISNLSLESKENFKIPKIEKKDDPTSLNGFTSLTISESLQVPKIEKKSSSSTKVKTTKEILENLQIKTTIDEPKKEDASKLTGKSDKKREKNKKNGKEENIVVEKTEPQVPTGPRSLSVEECMSLLPPIDYSCLEDEEEYPCSCKLKKNPDNGTYYFDEDPNCLANLHFNQEDKKKITDDQVNDLHFKYLPSVNGNYGLGLPKPVVMPNEQGLFENVVPNENLEYLPKYLNYEPMQTEGAVVTDGRVFREWYEMCETPSYNFEPLKILPYVTID